MPSGVLREEALRVDAKDGDGQLGRELWRISAEVLADVEGRCGRDEV